MKLFQKISVLFLTGLLCSCRTDGVFMHEIPGSASDARKAIVSVIGEPKSTSSNGQELVSRYHDKDGQFNEDTKNNKERRFTRITILGDRRPFDLQIEVVIEKKSIEAGYEFFALDEALAKEMATKIKKALNQSLDKRNIIDDFRAF